MDYVKAKYAPQQNTTRFDDSSPGAKEHLSRRIASDPTASGFSDLRDEVESGELAILYRYLRHTMSAECPEGNFSREVAKDSQVFVKPGLGQGLGKAVWEYGRLRPEGVTTFKCRTRNGDSPLE